MVGSAGRRLSATLIALFAAGLVLLFVARTANALLLLFIAILLAVYLAAVTDVLVRRARVIRPLALAVAGLGTVGAAILVGWLILPPVVRQTEDFLTSLPIELQRLEAFLIERARDYPPLEALLGANNEAGTLLDSTAADIRAYLQNAVLPYLKAGGRFLVELVSVLAMAVYLARAPRAYQEGLIGLVPPRVRHVARTIVVDLGDTLRAWIWAQLLAMSVLGLLTTIGLYLLGVPYAMAFGAFAAVAAVVPFFGTVASTALPALFVLSINGWAHALAVVGLGAGVHLVEANVIVPLLFSERISLPPALTILSVLIMASLLGVLGLVVAVPFLASTIVVVRHVLLAQIYGQYPSHGVPPAVLVSTTGEQRVVTVPP